MRGAGRNPRNKQRFDYGVAISLWGAFETVEGKWTELGFPAIRVGDCAISAIRCDREVTTDLGGSSVRGNRGIVTNYRSDEVCERHGKGKAWVWKRRGSCERSSVPRVARIL